MQYGSKGDAKHHRLWGLQRATSCSLPRPLVSRPLIARRWPLENYSKLAALNREYNILSLAHLTISTTGYNKWGQKHVKSNGMK